MKLTEKDFKVGMKWNLR